MKIGILAFQGAFLEHQQKMESLGVETVQVRTSAQLQDLDGLIIPGGESTTIGKLANDFNMLRFSTCLSSTDGRAYKKTTSWNYDKFLESEDFAGVQELAKAAGPRPTFLCINNHGASATYVTKLLKHLFYKKSMFEV